MASHSSALVAGLVCLSVAAVVVPMPWLAAEAAGKSSIGLEGCNTSCGGVDIPFPFGMGLDQRCWLPGFQILCNDTGNGVFKPFMQKYAREEVLDISLEKGETRMLGHISSYCYNSTSGRMDSDVRHHLLENNFSFSSTGNKFMVVGCRSLAYIGYIPNNGTPGSSNYQTAGCVSMCFSRRISLNPCSGMGCCQTAIPTGLRYSNVIFEDEFMNISAIKDGERSYGRCSFAVLMDSSSNFMLSNSNSNSNSISSPEQLSAFYTSRGGMAPVVLDWSIGGDNDSCKMAPTKPGYACVSSNSFCLDAARGRGYICKCNQGFHGNPYLTDGCQDIDECALHYIYPCYGVCMNTIGSFTCDQKDPFPLQARVVTGISVGLLVALAIALLSTKVLQVFRNMKRRRAYFKNNGGLMLLRILQTEGNNNSAFTLYDRGDLVKATRRFHKDNIIGEGAHGTVYKAILGTATVAVKRCKQINKSGMDEFVQELVVLCRVSHPNVVRLLGCCLHFEVPLLVYEFEPNGTLSDLLHGRPRRRVVTLPTRLRIAAETAEVLAHLHSPPHPTLHGDVKPQNILLGKGYVAKVSDFGCSTINDNVQVVPKGTLAYLDPQFLQDLQISDKTDVYSFGVVLIELLTGKNPQAKEGKNLTVMFQDSMGNGTLGDLLDADIVEEGSMALIYAAAMLASRCIAVPGNGRPAMEEVSVELRRFSDEMPESPEARAALEVEDDGSSYTATEGQTTTGFSSLPALSAELSP